MSDIDTAAVDSLKVLDPKRPIREADIEAAQSDVRFTPNSGHQNCLEDADRNPPRLTFRW